MQQSNQNTAFKPLTSTNNTTNSEHLDVWLQHLLSNGSIASGNVPQLRAAAAALSAQQQQHQQQFQSVSALSNGGNTSGLTPTSTAAALLLHHQQQQQQQQQQQYNAAAVAMAATQNATESLPQKMTNIDRETIEVFIFFN